MTVRDFWRRAYRLPRIAMVFALVAAVLNATSFLGGAPLVPDGAIIVMHIAVTLLFLALFVRMVYERMRSAWRRNAEQVAGRLPKPLVWVTVASLVYFLGVLIGSVVIYGERSPIPDVVSLRIFSSAWLFFLLLITLLSHRAEEPNHQGKPAITRRESL